MYLGLLVCKTYIQQENLKSYKLTMPLKIAEVMNNHSKDFLIFFKNSHKSNYIARNRLAYILKKFYSGEETCYH